MSTVRLTTTRFVLSVFVALMALALPRATSAFNPIAGGSHARSITVTQIPNLIDIPGVAGQEKPRVGSGDLVNVAPDSLLVPRGASAGGREATGFLGSRRAPLSNAPYQPLQNADAVIGGRTFSGHALDQMRNRGLTPSVVENTVQTGVRSVDPIPGRVRFYDPVNDVSVILEGERVITARPGGF